MQPLALVVAAMDMALMAAKGELKAVAGVVVADPLATHGDIRAPSIKAVLAAAALTLGGVEEVGAIMGAEEAALIIATL